MSSAKYKSARYAEGTIVKLPCTIKPGMHPGERYVEVDIDPKILGFANAHFIEDPDGESCEPHEGFIVMTVAYKTEKCLGMLFPGEVFSVTNPICITEEMLEKIEVT